MANTPIRKNERGVALILALVSVVLITYLAKEVSEDVGIEFLVTASEVNRLKAYYAAQAGVELSLLRLYIYKNAVKQYGEQLGSNRKMLDMIWQMPFTWPFRAPVDLGAIGNEALKEIENESFMEAQFVTTLNSEGSKLDLNDLISPSKSVATNTRIQLIQILQQRLDQDDDWARDYENDSTRPTAEELVNNIADWIDTDEESRNGGDESSNYRDLGPGFPPNQPFKTLDELRMVDGMSDALFNLYAPQVTVYGLKGLQVNFANKEALMSLDPQMTKEIADEILKRRNDEDLGGPFKDFEDFKGFLKGQGLNTAELEKHPEYYVFDAEYNFRIQSIGSFGKSRREIIAVAYDFDKVVGRLTDSVKKEKAADSGAGGSGGTDQAGQPAQPAQPSDPNAKKEAPKEASGPPQIVYWSEQ